MTLETGGSGGIVTPIFFIGATGGAGLAHFVGLPTGVVAAFGFVSVLAAAANTPIAAAVMGMELLPTQLGVYAALCAGTAYLIVGHRSVYASQKLGLSKSAGLDVVLDVPIGRLTRSGLRIRDGSLTGRRLRRRRPAPQSPPESRPRRAIPAPGVTATAGEDAGGDLPAQRGILREAERVELLVEEDRRAEPGVASLRGGETRAAEIDDAASRARRREDSRGTEGQVLSVGETEAVQVDPARHSEGVQSDLQRSSRGVVEVGEDLLAARIREEPLGRGNRVGRCRGEKGIHGTHEPASRLRRRHRLPGGRVEKRESQERAPRGRRGEEEGDVSRTLPA